MKKWEQTLVEAVVAFLLALVFWAWANQAVEPITVIKQGSDVTVDFDEFFIGLLILSAMLFGVGIASLPAALTMRKLEEK